MRPDHRFSPLLQGFLLSSLLGFSVGGCASQPATVVTLPSPPAATVAAPSVPSLRDTHEQLQGTLWMQTAAEYTALAMSTYRSAGEALSPALADPSWSAALEQTGDTSHLPSAVILDLDETVLDNSRFQGEQVERRVAYTYPLWTEWVRREQAELIPGARDFLELARRLGVAIFFVTNRAADLEAATLANLHTLGLSWVTREQILCRDENQWPADKSTRRQHVAASHRVLLLVGDDLGDFLAPPATLAERLQATMERADWWGKRWFLLPNPMYGSWERALYPPGSRLSDTEQLQLKRSLVKAFP
jgi:5'-nucleotidase (lipoprotein e(P4) family)